MQPEIDRSFEGRETAPQLRPRIYVASLSDYNAGQLHGEWIDAAQPVELLEAAVSAMLAASPSPMAEEWAIHDYDDFKGIGLGEFESLEVVSRLAGGLVEHGRAFGAWADHVGSDTEEVSGFEEAFRGEWPSLEAYAQELLSDLGLEDILDRLVPDWLSSYVTVDAAGFGRDLVLGGDLVVRETTAGTVWIFDGRTG